jgi:hypothetical protein
MSKLSPIEIYKVLPKTNCRECLAPTCMAFAAAVAQGQKRLADCPYLDDDAIARLGDSTETRSPAEKKLEETLRSLKEQVSNVTLSERAERIGAEIREGRMVVKSLGKDFEINASGNIDSHCHTHVWFSILLLNYVLFSKGREPSGEWAPFRLLKNGAGGSPLFEQRCEKPLKAIADEHPELFEDLTDIFNGTRSESFDSDIAVVLYPFPKLPLAVCYWKPDGDMESQLHIFFDRSAEQNLNIEMVLALGTGLATMLEKIILKHKHD